MRRFLSSKAAKSSSLRGGAAARAFVFDLNKGINDCTSFRELESLLFTLDKRALGQGPVLGNAMLRMGKLRSVERSIADEYVHKSSVVGSLLDLCCAPEVKFPNISSVFHGMALGKLAKQVPKKLMDQLESQLHELRPNQLSTCLFSMATLKQTNCGAVLQKIEHEICSKFPLSELTPEQLVYLAWGFASLQSEYKASRFFCVLLDHLLSLPMKDFTVPQLTHLVWAYSHFEGDGGLQSKLYRQIKDELLSVRGGWRAVRNANTMAGMVISFAPKVFDGEDDFALALKDLSHNRNVKDIDSDLLLGLVERFAARRQAATNASFFQAAAQELVDRHFRGLDSTQMVSVLHAYTMLGNYSCIALFDKAAKELIKPKHWKPCTDCKLAYALANLPLPHPQHVTSLVQKLTLEHIDDRKEWLRAAWSLTALGRQMDVPDVLPSGDSEEEVRMAQDLALAWGKEMIPSSAVKEDKVREAIQAHLEAEFKQVEHVVKQINFAVDFYLPKENAVIEFARYTSNSPANTFRHRLLKQHLEGCRVFVLPRTTTMSNKSMLAALDLVVKQIRT